MPGGAGLGWLEFRAGAFAGPRRVREPREIPLRSRARRSSFASRRPQPGGALGGAGHRNRGAGDSIPPRARGTREPHANTGGLVPTPPNGGILSREDLITPRLRLLRPSRPNARRSQENLLLEDGHDAFRDFLAVARAEPRMAGIDQLIDAGAGLLPVRGTGRKVISLAGDFVDDAAEINDRNVALH